MHDLRHSYASWLVQAGLSLYQVAALLGHADPASTARYTHLPPEAIGRALAILDGGPESA